MDKPSSPALSTISEDMDPAGRMEATLSNRAGYMVSLPRCKKLSRDSRTAGKAPEKVVSAIQAPAADDGEVLCNKCRPPPWGSSPCENPFCSSERAWELGLRLGGLESALGTSRFCVSKSPKLNAAAPRTQSTRVFSGVVHSTSLHQLC